MKKPTAKKVSELMLFIGAQLDQSLAEVKNTENETDFRRYRDSVSKLMTTMLLEVMNPLYAEHPDLKPPQLE